MNHRKAIRQQERRHRRAMRKITGGLTPAQYIAAVQRESAALLGAIASAIRNFLGPEVRQ